MSVIVNSLTKVYGKQKAVNNISFEAKPGEVLGFLGPNGAGKSTTMKIITCFMPQTAGKVKVCGFDTEVHAMEVRRRIGYLPEHNPLYKDMYVKEYLHFVARVHGVKKPKNRIAELIELTGLGAEQHKYIGALSKGYRQRVGLAQAMLHDPEVLILDEPTSGLDPNQLIEVRELIKALGREKTVILSTHIMQEVQAICKRVVIINNGQLVANDDIEALKMGNGGHSTYSIGFKEVIDRSLLIALPGVVDVIAVNEYYWKVMADQAEDIRPTLFNFAVDHQLTMIELHQKEKNVESVFQELTRSVSNS